MFLKGRVMNLTAHLPLMLRLRINCVTTPNYIAYSCMLTQIINETNKPAAIVEVVKVKKGKVHPCTGTEALYRPYGP